MRRRNLFLVIGGIIIAAGIVLLLVFMVKANNKRRSAETLAQIQLLEREVEYYKKLSEVTNQRLLDCQDLFIILKKNDMKEAQKPASRPEPAAKAPAPNPKKEAAPVVQTTTNTVERPAVTQEPIVVAEPVVTATPVVAGFDSLKDINGDILFCVMANNHGGLHFPQKALDLGVKIQGTQSNHTGDGTNFVIRQVMNGLEGDYGLTKDGKFFVSNRLIETTLSRERTPLSSMALKGTFTGWAPREMSKEGDYWVLQAL